MRFQVKEALEKVSEKTLCDPNAITIHKIEPNHIHLSCIDELDTQVEFIYTDGELSSISSVNI